VVTKQNLSSMGVEVERDLCVTCGELTQTVIHLFFSCKYAIESWNLCNK